MIWNCNGEVKEIKFKYSSAFKEHCCCVNTYIYVWEKVIHNVGPWDWLKEGYSLNWARWVKI